MRYGLFLGCNMPAIRPDVERAIRTCMPRLGVDLVDLEGYVCCPAFGTFPSLDEHAQLAVNAWNLSLGEEKGLDLLVECGSCYSSLRTGRALLAESEERRGAVAELLAEGGRSYQGRARARHITDVLETEVGLERIRESVVHRLDGVHAVVQYPCHTLYPSEVVGFEPAAGKPRALGALVEACGAQVDHFSLEHQCCGGAGGFHRASKAEADAFAGAKLEAIHNETEAEVIVVACITCLLFLDGVQMELARSGVLENPIPVLDVSQLIALCQGAPASEVAAIAAVPRERFLARFGPS